MNRIDINIVWLKRDLRTQDHAALHAAEQDGRPYRIIYLFEPGLMQHADSSTRHLQFAWHSIRQMNNNLASHDRCVDSYYEDAERVFTALCEQYCVRKVFSYCETGVRLSWQRDKRVRQVLAANRVEWIEFQRDGIERGINDRKGWDGRWYRTMRAPLIENRFSRNTLAARPNPWPLPADLKAQLEHYPAAFQPAGEQQAAECLAAFTAGRGARYHLDISSPQLSRESCGRLSPYLAWGNISIRQAYQHIRYHADYQRHRRAFAGILTRLKWHCHFIQKFEVEIDYEDRCINRGYESLHHEYREDLVAAWRQGRTGYPLIDACMRCLHETGWVNFRMRAMLASFLCHHLDQDWRTGVNHLARLFLDYEPGIHYPQFQMQAGTTGINIVRMYNPVKQSTDHDADGEFIRRWLPELANVPLELIHQPWTMTPMEEAFHGVSLGEDYPLPVIDHVATARLARKKIWAHRKLPAVRAERQRLLATHTRRGGVANNRQAQR